MDHDAFDADLFEVAGEAGGGDLGGVPAEAHFDGDGDLDGVDDGFDETDGLIGGTHHGGPCPVLGDVFDGAAHVDVDEVDAHAFEHLSGVAHDPGFVAEDLDGEGTVVVVGLDHLESFGAAFDKGSGVDEVGRGEPDAAEATDETAECEVGIAGEWGDEVARGERDGSDAQGVALADVFGDGGEGGHGGIIA